MPRKLGIGIYLFVVLAPITLGLGYSLLYSLGLIGLVNDGFTLKHWVKLFSSSDSLGSIIYSFKLTLISLALILLVSLALSWRIFVRRGKLSTIVLLPLLFPPLIAAFSWFYLLSPGGWISRLAFQFGFINELQDFPRLVNDSADFGILISHVFLVFPLFTALFHYQSEKIGMDKLLQISSNLGASSAQFFRKIYLPLVLKRSLPVMVLYSIFLFGTYEVPLILGRTSPRPVSVFIEEKLSRFDLQQIPVGHAMAVFYSLLIITLILIFIRKRSLSL